MTDRAKRLVPFAGVAYVALMVVGIGMTNTPDSTDPGSKVIAYYQAHHTRLSVSVFIFAYAALLTVVYYTSLASYLRRAGADVLATATVVGGAVLALGLLISAGASSALIDVRNHIDAGQAQTLNAVAEDLFAIAFFAGVALATLASGLSMLRTRSLPKWLGILTVIVGVGALTGVGSWIAFMATGPLTIATAILVYRGLGRPAEVKLPDLPKARASVEDTGSKKPREHSA